MIMSPLYTSHPIDDHNDEAEASSTKESSDEAQGPKVDSTP